MEVSLPCFGILFLVTIALGQIPIPPRMTGYTYKQPSTVPSVKIGFYIGPLCPDSQQAFPTLLNVASSYAAEDVSLVTHLFPLPFHHHSFLAAKVNSYHVIIVKFSCYSRSFVINFCQCPPVIHSHKSYTFLKLLVVVRRNYL